MKSLLFALATLVTASSFAAAYNVNIQGTLLDSDPGQAGVQPIFPGNTPGGFLYKYENDGNKEEGTSAGIDLFTTTEDTETKFVVTWVGVQPYLTTFYLKAGGKGNSDGGYLKWDISNFNSGVYKSIVVENLDVIGIVNKNNGDAREISHIQIDGRPGTTRVADGSYAASLLGLAVIGLVALRRRSRR